MRPIRRLARALAAAAGVAACAASADATWSIIIVDTRTGEIAIGSATCLTGFDLQLNASIVVPGIGAAAAQSFVDQTGQNRVFIYDQMLRATPPSEIITRLAGFDSGHQTRQYGIVDLRDNGRAATFTGTGAGQYRGGVTGRLVGGGPTGGDLVYAVQGNVLTGAPVIDAAVAAIRNDPGDVPEKLMRAMEAAMRMGGDGRCSCNQGNPTGCGSPPDDFTRSAYIAYMVVSRAGDRPGCNGIYRLNGTGPGALVATDVNADGSPDLVLANQATSNVSVLWNTIASGWATFGLPMNYPVGTSPRDLVTADFDADTHPDLATANFTSNNVTFLRGQANGSFVGRTDVGAANGPVGLATADFDRDGDIDVAVICQGASSLVILANNGAGAFSLARTVPLASIPVAIGAGDLDLDGDTDLALAVSTSPLSSVLIARNTTPKGGSPDFTIEPPIIVGRGINSVAVGNLDADNRPDIATLSVNDSAINVLGNLPGGFERRSDVAFTIQGTWVAIGDATGDGRPDLVAATRSTPQRFSVFAGTGNGFEQARQFVFGQTPARFTLADLNLDGGLDFAAALFNNAQTLTVRNTGRGEFNSGAGCASGDYWLDLNVANVPAGAPDPVPILRQQLDARRLELAGATDAIRSTAEFQPAHVRADGLNSADLLITLRDANGGPVAPAPERIVEVFHADAETLGTSIGPVSLVSPGVYRARVTSGFATGSVGFRVRVWSEPGRRAVVLMPPPTLGLLHRADWDESGVVDAADFAAFLDAFMQGAQDFNHDGVPNSQDFFDFLSAFFER
jgi:hypothetical protein